MSVCVRINGKKRKLCAGDLDNLIMLQNRDIVAPLDFGASEASEKFTDEDFIECMVVTRSGLTLFDGVQIEKVITHQFYIRYYEGLTAEWWGLFEGRRMDIVRVEDLEERHEWMRLDCSETGTTEKQANDA